MAPLPTIANVYRVVLNWSTVGGVAPINVFHVNAIADTVDDVRTGLSAAMTESMFSVLSEAFTLDSMSITPLDGTSATETAPFGVTFTGQATGQVIFNLSGCLLFSTTRRGARGRGRMFIGPTTEDINQGNNGWTSTVRNNLVTAWQDFQDGLTSEDPVISLGVASYAHADFHGVTAISTADLLRSTKSRLNQVTR